jgi:hypothetical protein
MNGQDKILDGLKMSIIGMGEMQNSLLKTLDKEQVLKFNKFQENYASLIASGDVVGASKLADKFKEENK